MAHIIKPRVADTTTTAGNGILTLAAAPRTGFRTFSAVCAIGDTFLGWIGHQSAAEWEEGIYTYSAANQITRTQVLDSSNAGAAVAFSAGTKDVAMGPIAQGFAQDVQLPMVARGVAITSGTGIDLRVKQRFTVNVNGATFNVINPANSPFLDGLFVNMLVTFTTANIIAWGTKFKGLALYTPSGSGKKDSLTFQYDLAADLYYLVGLRQDVAG